MTRISKKKLPLDLEKESLNGILKEVKNLNSIIDLEFFLDSFFTADEKKVILRRNAISYLLKIGKKYSEIKDLLDVSRATISNVKDIIDGRGYGRNPDRKRKYSSGSILAWGGNKKKIPITRLRYKGGQGIV